MQIDSKAHQVDPGVSVDLGRMCTSLVSPEEAPSKGKLKSQLLRSIKQIRRWQELLFAEKQQSLLVVFQGMDTSGKDSAIKNVFTGINPAGLRVYSFGVPTATELDQTFLQRFWDKLPPRGFIHVFNRSYYEEITVVRVHPTLLEKRKVETNEVDELFWCRRIDDITSFEDHLLTNKTRLLKIFLHISKEEQLRRLVKRLDDPKRMWKFDPSDLRDRAHWDNYLSVYSECISATSTDSAPWYVIPSDNKQIARLLVADAMISVLSEMDPALPQLDDEQKAALSSYKQSSIDELRKTEM